MQYTIGNIYDTVSKGIENTKKCRSKTGQLGQLSVSLGQFFLSTVSVVYVAG